MICPCYSSISVCTSSSLKTDASRAPRLIRTNFRWTYPPARSHAKDRVLAFRHFVATGDEVGMFYSNSAPSIKIACRENLMGTKR